MVRMKTETSGKEEQILVGTIINGFPVYLFINTYYFIQKLTGGRDYLFCF